MAFGEYALIIAVAVVAIIIAIAMIATHMVQGTFCHFTGGAACRKFGPPAPLPAPLPA
jgi:hypothetical protein